MAWPQSVRNEKPVISGVPDVIGGNSYRPRKRLLVAGFAYSLLGLIHLIPCMPENVPTRQTVVLANALRARNVNVAVEHWDGHKHIDIYLPDARIYIEVDGLKHYVEPKQIIADLRRDHFSDGDDFSTMRITNQLVDTHLNEIADAIAGVVLRKKS